MLRVRNLRYAYKSHGKDLTILDGLSFDVPEGDWVSIQGKSGAGKSTLFYLMGGLLRPKSGEIIYDGTDVTKLSDSELSVFRNQKIGFVFQQFHLLPRATVLENILLPSRFVGDITPEKTASFRERATMLASRVGLSGRLEHSPHQLSGGEQQRVALARALLLEPKFILADEPTGNLDGQNSDEVLRILGEFQRAGTTILLITHDPLVAAKCPRQLYLDKGRVVEQVAVPDLPPETAEDRKRQRSYTLPTGWLKSSYQSAMQNIRRNRTRAVLTMIGVTVGIAALFSMVTFGKFAKDQIMAGFEELGSNSMALRGWANWQREATDDIDLIFEAFDWEKDLKPLQRIFPSIDAISPMMMGYGTTANYGGRQITSDLQTWGVGADMIRITSRGITRGRPILALDVEDKASVCLIGTEVVTRLFPREEPLGKIIFMAKKDGNAFSCRVIGILAHQSSNMDWRKPDFDVIMPFTYFTSVSETWEAKINTFVFKVKSSGDVERTGKAVRNFFRTKYGKAGEFMVDTNMVLIAQIKKSLVLFTLLLSTIALVTLGVGGMGIHNMMLVSLAERFKEIGLFKALGASDKSLRWQFLMESTFLSVLAGLLGLFVGFSVYQAVIYIASKAVSKITFGWVIDPFAILLSLGSILLVGILSGMLPAIKAERLSVIDALRSE